MNNILYVLNRFLFGLNFGNDVLKFHSPSVKSVVILDYNTNTFSSVAWDVSVVAFANCYLRVVFEFLALFALLVVQILYRFLYCRGAEDKSLLIFQNSISRMKFFFGCNLLVGWPALLFLTETIQMLLPYSPRQHFTIKLSCFFL